jgi:hypothetical protein
LLIHVERTQSLVYEAPQHEDIHVAAIMCACVRSLTPIFLYCGGASDFRGSNDDT